MRPRPPGTGTSLFASTRQVRRRVGRRARAAPPSPVAPSSPVAQWPVDAPPTTRPRTLGPVPHYPRRPVPEPLDTNAVPVMLTGIGLWAVAGLVMLAWYGHLVHTGNTWWLWTCVAGVLSGAALLGYELWRRARHRAGKVEPRPGEPPPPARR